jgi:hypothetical protein
MSDIGENGNGKRMTVAMGALGVYRTMLMVLITVLGFFLVRIVNTQDQIQQAVQTMATVSATVTTKVGDHERRLGVLEEEDRDIYNRISPAPRPR